MFRFFEFAYELIELFAHVRSSDKYILIIEY